MQPMPLRNQSSTRLILVAGLSLLATLMVANTQAEEGSLPASATERPSESSEALAAEQPPLPSDIATPSQEPESQTIQELKASLLEAQKQAYERELKLNELRRRLAVQSETTGSSKTPWIQINASGQVGLNAEQPAISSPKALQTSLQYYKHQYRIKPGDKLSIGFIGADPNLAIQRKQAGNDTLTDSFQQVTVLTDGTIALPLLGLIEVAGKSLKEVNDELNKEMKNYYLFANVTVGMAEAAPDTVLVLGQIKKQGYVKVSVGTTVSQIFKESGGVESRADLEHVLVRKKETGNVYMIDILSVLEKGDVGQDIMLQSGDLVVIPEGEAEISYENYAGSPFLPQEFEVKVLGAVKRPDVYLAKPGDNLATALAKAGGPAPHAKNNSILLVRQDGTMRTWKVISFKQADLVPTGNQTIASIALRPNDFIIVEDPLWRRTQYNLLSGGMFNTAALFAGQSLFHNLLAD